MSHRPDRSSRFRHVDARPAVQAPDLPVPSGARVGRRSARDAMQRVVRPVFARKSRGIATRSDDGVIEFLLMPRSGRLLVQRIELLPGSIRVVHIMSFGTRDAFDRWCLADRLQFHYPLLYANLRRSGHELFDTAG